MLNNLFVTSLVQDVTTLYLLLTSLALSMLFTSFLFIFIFRVMVSCCVMIIPSTKESLLGNARCLARLVRGPELILYSLYFGGSCLCALLRFCMTKHCKMFSCFHHLLLSSLCHFFPFCTPPQFLSSEHRTSSFVPLHLYSSGLRLISTSLTTGFNS